jgi:hypothetical protein
MSKMANHNTFQNSIPELLNHQATMALPTPLSDPPNASLPPPTKQASQQVTDLFPKSIRYNAATVNPAKILSRFNISAPNPVSSSTYSILAWLAEVLFFFGFFPPRLG